MPNLLVKPIIQNNTITNNTNGIYLYMTPAIILENNILNNLYGISISNTHKNPSSIRRNNISNNTYGIEIFASSGNFLQENLLNNNSFCIGFGRAGGFLEDYVHYIDTTNLVNGKPVYYLINQHNLTIDPVRYPEVGYLALINSTDITVKNLTLANSAQGLLFAFTNNSKIIHTNVVNNEYGICLLTSYNNFLIENNVTSSMHTGILLGTNNTLIGNNIRTNGYGVSASYNNFISKNYIIENTEYGIFMTNGASNNTITENNIKRNKKGVYLYYYTFYNVVNKNNIEDNQEFGVWIGYNNGNNTVVANNITNNGHGIRLEQTSYNVIFHNNFMNNTHQASTYAYSLGNLWDNSYPSGGNYWSNYTGSDEFSGLNQDQPGSDGIGDTPYEIDADNADRYPLMASYSTFDSGVWNEVAYNVDVVSNSTVSAFYFNPDEGAFLRLNVTGNSETAGFCRVAIPKDLLWAEDGWTILVGGEPTEYTIASDENFIYLYFTYQHSTKTVTIQGTHVIPEFPSSIIMPLFMILTMVAIVFAKKKAQKRET